MDTFSMKKGYVSTACNGQAHILGERRPMMSPAAAAVRSPEALRYGGSLEGAKLSSRASATLVPAQPGYCNSGGAHHCRAISRAPYTTVSD